MESSKSSQACRQAVITHRIFFSLFFFFTFVPIETLNLQTNVVVVWLMTVWLSGEAKENQTSLYLCKKITVMATKKWVYLFSVCLCLCVYMFRFSELRQPHSPVISILQSVYLSDVVKISLSGRGWRPSNESSWTNCQECQSCRGIVMLLGHRRHAFL